MNLQTYFSSNSQSPSRNRFWTPAHSRNWKFPIVGQTTAIDGTEWYIRDVRPTKHGFDLYYGSPVDRRGPNHGNGLCRLIDTRELFDFWDRNRLKIDGTVFNLPAGRTTLKRARARMGFNNREDYDQFWMDHMDELRELTPLQFGRKYGIAKAVVKDWRFKLLGRTARELGWWKTPGTIRILTAGLTFKETGKLLGIGITHAKRLRTQAQALLASESGNQNV